MGAALTYARRYALFTLVGIAGEDDLDAPDLAAPTSRTGPARVDGNTNSRLNGSQRVAAPRNAARREATVPSRSPTAFLGAEAPAELRDRLIAELNDLGSGDEAALWAHRCLPEKNRLNATDAQSVEEAFQSRLEALVANDVDVPATGQVGLAKPNAQHTEKSKKQTRAKRVDKSGLAWPEPRRVRDRDHVKSVAKRHCLVCGRRPVDAHHLRFAQSRALGRKVSDEFTVPLCRGHHREVHRSGDEAAWWRNAGIDPTVSARTLWLESHPLANSQSKIGSMHRRGIHEQSLNHETKPIGDVAANDLT
jgi:hypothetical protein